MVGVVHGAAIAPYHQVLPSLRGFPYTVFFERGLDASPLLLGRTSEKAIGEKLCAPAQGSIFRLLARGDQEILPSLGLVFPRGLLRRVHPRAPLRKIFLAALDQRATAAPV